MLTEKRKKKLRNICSTNNTFVFKFAVLVWLAFFCCCVFQKARPNLDARRVLQAACLAALGASLS